MLSLMSSTSSLPATHLDMPCFLPDQHRVHTTIYFPFALVSIVILMICNLYQPRRQNKLFADRDLTLQLPTSNPPTVWSPAAPPMSPMPSPLGTLSPGLRTPIPNSASKTYAATPIRRTSTRPPSPLMSPLPSPPSERFGDGEEDDELYPVQYAARSEESASQFLHVGNHEEEEHHGPSSTFSAYFPAPRSSNSERYMDYGSRLPWSHSFVFAGRRRRITLPSPPGTMLSDVGQAIWLLACDLVKGKRGGSQYVSRDVFLDCSVVFIAAASWWGFIAWIFS